MRKTLRWYTLFFPLLLSIIAAGNEGRAMENHVLFPQEMLGWKAIGTERTYKGEAIFDYIDGGGEVYLTYGFKEVTVRNYQKEGEPEIIAELYDMGNSEDAFGIFSFEREGGTVGIGQDSEYESGLLRFWKGRFFITVTSERETPSARQAIMTLGRAISDRIKEEGKRSELLSFLPGEGIVSEQVRFFHKDFNLNYHYFVAENNILLLDKDTTALLAPYSIQGSRSYLLIISYEDNLKADKAYRTFIAAYMPEAKKIPVLQTENGRWTAARKWKNRVLVVFDAPSRDSCTEIIQDSLGLMEKNK